jgi:hypothetical protein
VRASHQRIFDGFVEKGDDFACGRDSLAGLIWITSAMPLRHGRSARSGAG